MNDMIVRGNNLPVFKKKISSVINQWRNPPDYDQLFSLPEKEFNFEYSDLMSCNQKVLELNDKIKGLEELIGISSDGIYEEIIIITKRL